MKTIFGWRRHRYLRRVGIFLVTVVLTTGMMGCPLDSDPDPILPDYLEYR
ncbi:MAG: hypothetical protein R6V59_07370 [Dehalococcoidia bacterium]